MMVDRSMDTSAANFVDTMVVTVVLVCRFKVVVLCTP
jgi:hypothetical protein